jgi:hypothetical protein
MPLLFNHDMNEPLGMVDVARVDGDRLMVDAHLFDTPRANEMRSMIEGGLRNVSIGYRLHEVSENKDSSDSRRPTGSPTRFPSSPFPLTPRSALAGIFPAINSRFAFSAPLPMFHHHGASRQRCIA